MNSPIDQALAQSLGFNPDTKPESEEETFPLMVIKDPVPPAKEIKKLDTEKDTKEDYDLARRINLNLLEQQQEMIKSMANFLNACPSARAYEVMNQMMKTATEMTKDLLGLQEQLKTIQAKPDKNGGGDEKGGDTYIFAGGPSEILERVAKAIDKERQTIDITPEK